jgi:hypothetical protein
MMSETPSIGLVMGGQPARGDRTGPSAQDWDELWFWRLDKGQWGIAGSGARP